MLLAINYDGTYTRDPLFWNAVMALAVSRGHQTIGTTLRDGDGDDGDAVRYDLAGRVDDIIFSSGAAKHAAAYAAGYSPSVWCESQPATVLDGGTREPAGDGAMLLALDYDDTYTRDPLFWDHVIALATSHGHAVLCATMRYEHEGDPVKRALQHQVDTIIFTGRKAKQRIAAAAGFSPSVWIDDCPSFIYNDAKEDLEAADIAARRKRAMTAFDP